MYVFAFACTAARIRHSTYRYGIYQVQDVAAWFQAELRGAGMAYIVQSHFQHWLIQSAKNVFFNNTINLTAQVFKKGGINKTQGAETLVGLLGSRRSGLSSAASVEAHHSISTESTGRG